LPQKFGVCFVCLGNIVRSPLAEHIFLQIARERGVADLVRAASAGTGNWHVGEAPDARMRQVAARHGLVYDGRARQFKQTCFDDYDLIIAMDTDNQKYLLGMARQQEDRQKVRLLREFDASGGPKASVPDPYYSGMDGFEEVFQVIKRSVEGLFENLDLDQISRGECTDRN
jgi:protein-tyrosine phosphatase